MNAQLCRSTLRRLADHVALPSYAFDKVRRSVVHIGVGNFHRIHQAVYCDDLLCAGELLWGVTGISLRSPKTRNALAPQDYLYTMAQLDGNVSYRVIGAIREIIAVSDDSARAIDVLAARTTELITITVTEKGYLLGDGSIDFSHEAYCADLMSLQEPRTVYGYLAAAIIRRSQAKTGPMTILCCDNIQGGGDILRQGALNLLQEHSVNSACWVDDNVSFVSSVVDRVAPTTTEKFIRDTTQAIGVHDHWPVATEPFRQWVIEDKFAGVRPPFDAVGATYVDDVAPYERMKLAFLNAAHSIIAVVGYLLGEDYIHTSLEHGDLARLVRATLVEEIHAVTPLPLTVSGFAYIDNFLRRFQNAALPYRVTQVCSDSTEKIQQRWFPSIDRLIEHGQSPQYMAFASAAWIACVRQAVTDEALVDSRRDELIEKLGGAYQSDEIVRHTLDIAGAARQRFRTDASFMALVDDAYRDICGYGVGAAMNKVVRQLQSKRSVRA